MSGRAQTSFVILAHSDAPMVRRLISTLHGADVFLHCDAATPADVARAMVPDGARDVHLIPRRKMKLASWSLVEAELAGLEMALEHSTAEHIAIVSGSSYPLASLEGIDAMLGALQGSDGGRAESDPVLQLEFPLDRRRWNVALQTSLPDTWRQLGDTVRQGRSALAPKFPGRWSLHGSAQWKTYSRAHARALLDALNTATDQRPYWKHVYLPEESCAVSILKSPRSGRRSGRPGR